MKRLFISTACLSGDRALFPILDCLHESNIMQVELSAPHEHIPQDQLIDNLKLYCQKGMEFIIHNYFPIPPTNFVFNLATNDSDIRDLSIQHLEDAFSLTNQVGASLFAFHPGYYYDAIEASNGQFIMDPYLKTNKRTAYNNFKNSLNQCKLLSKKHNVWFAVENLFPMPVGESIAESSLFCRLEEIEKLQDDLADNLKMGLLIDLGHLQISAHYFGFSKDIFMEKMISRFENKIFEIHLSENDSINDTHECFSSKDCWQLDWARRLNKLNSSIPGGIKFTLESRRLSGEQLNLNISIIREALEG